MNIFRRLFNIGQAEAHSTIDKMEDPIKMTEQGIRDMKADLSKALEGLAQVKAMLIRSTNEKEQYESKAEDYQKKAMLILQKVEKGDIAPEEGDRLATEALLKKEENAQHSQRSTQEIENFQKSVSQLQSNVNSLKTNINKWENELKTLKARVQVSDATKNLNKQMASIDTSSTVSMLEKMKAKVVEDEALAEAYGEIAKESTSIDDEIDQAIDTKKVSAEESLKALKDKMGLN